MNLASKDVGTSTAVGSDGIVAAGVYVDGRQVASIAIEEASVGAASRATWSGLVSTSRIWRS